MMERERGESNITDLEYFIKEIEDYRNGLSDRRNRRESYKFIESNDRGYINAMGEVIIELYKILENIKIKIKGENNAS